MATEDGGGEQKRVLRRCPHCRLLFEVAESVKDCVVCGVAIDGLALTVTPDVSAPTVQVERESTEPVPVPAQLTPIVERNET